MGSTMSHEHEPLLSKRGAHFEIENRSNSSTVAHDGAGRSEEGTSSLSLVADLKSQQHHQQQQQHNTTQQYNQQENGSEAAPIKNNTTNNHPSTNPPNDPKGASIFQTSLNIAKLCMGTGTLALPFAAEKGGLLFNVVGLGLIGLWNFYSADCLLRCCEFLPGGYNNTMEEDENVGELENGIKSGKNRGDNEKAIGSENQQQQQQHETIMYGTVDGNGNGDFHHESKTTKTTKTTTSTTAANHDNHQIYSKVSPPPGGTTTYGKVAWYASGPKGECCILLYCVIENEGMK